MAHHPDELDWLAIRDQLKLTAEAIGLPAAEIETAMAGEERAMLALRAQSPDERSWRRLGLPARCAGEGVGRNTVKRQFGPPPGEEATR